MPRRVARGTCLMAALWLGAGGAARAADAVRHWHALPVEGGTDAIAREAGLEPGLPAWRVLYEAVRRRHGLWGEDAGRGAEEAGAAREPGGSRVPLPLAPSFWRDLQRSAASLPDERLALAILADRRSAHLYRGLAGLDEETLAALAAEPETLRSLQRRQAALLATFGARFVVRGGVVAVPGGVEAQPLWEALIGASPREPARFLVRLLAKGEGRIAFLYDSLARLEPRRQRLALGLPASAGRDPKAPLRALARVFEADNAWWQKSGGAFARAEADAARLLREVRLTADGAIAPPTALEFWRAVFDDQVATPQAIRESPAVDLSWLASRVGSGDPRLRRLRLEQLSFAQRVFGEAAERAPLEAIEALSGLLDTRALVLTLERFGSRDPAFFAAAVAGARRSLSFQLPDDLSAAHAGFQGALAVVDRARFAGALDREAAERLVLSLLEVPLPAAVPWERGLGGWVQGTLVPALAEATGAEPGDADAAVLRAMAGVSGRPRERRAFEWEGLLYRVEPERAELRRLEAVRRRQAGPSLAAVLRSCREAPEGARHGCAGSVGAVLTSLVYAWHLGEPDGPALRGEDPSRRHAFLPAPWALATEAQGPGVDWHVRGSLLGMETALARLSLHRLDADAMPARAPVIDAQQRRRLVVAAGLADPHAASDADASALAAALARGRARAEALRPGSADLEAAARDAGLDPWRARALEWLLEHDQSALAGFFSLGELVHLGEPAGGPFDAWGAPDPTLAGLRLRQPPPRPLDEAAGRPPEAALAESFVDLGIRAAVHVSERGLPASLARGLVATLLPDLFFDARPLAPDDRLGLDAWVRGQPKDRLDDAVASLVGRGPLQPAAGPVEVP